jgi:NhaP-type Na+/H+ or K+/H+ antiporter
MLTQEDESFIRYWSEQRLRKKQFLRKTSFGFPLGVFIVLATMISLFSGWYKKADMVLHEYSSLIIMILIAGFGIVAFITIFSAQHKWDQNELHYQELLRKKEQENLVQQPDKN